MSGDLPFNPLLYGDEIQYQPKTHPLTEEQQIDICEAIIEHGTLARAEKEKAVPVTSTTIRKFVYLNEAFRKKFEASRMLGMEKLFDEALEVAYKANEDIFGVNKDGKPKISYECVNRSRLKVDTLFRVLAVVNPARYSEAFYRPKERRFKLRDAKSKRVPDRLDVVYDSIKDGEISPDEGAKVASVLESQQRAVDNHEILLRLEQLEEARDKSNVLTSSPK